jgi:hypothetical protein
MLTTCLDADDDLSSGPDGVANDALDNALPDPARDVTPSGTPHCKNAGAKVQQREEKLRSNRAERTAAS